MFEDSRPVPVRLTDGTEIYIQATPIDPTDVSAADWFDFSPVRAILKSLSAELAEALHSARPTKASVKVGLEVATKSGKLTALLVEGSGKANIEITLEWSAQTGANS